METQTPDNKRKHRNEGGIGGGPPRCAATPTMLPRCLGSCVLLYTALKPEFFISCVDDSASNWHVPMICLDRIQVWARFRVVGAPCMGQQAVVSVWS